EDLYDTQGEVLWHGNHSLHEVALTFDDGPHPGSCERILNTLKENGIVGTFFDVGINMRKHPELVRETLADGNEIGNHSYYHQRLHTLDPRERHREINDVDITYYRITGQHLQLLRPPGMRFNDEVLAMTRSLGYLVVGYDADSHDFDPKMKPDEIVDRTLSRTDNGCIILLHDYLQPSLALPRIIAALKARGYRFVTISQMVRDLPNPQRAQATQFVARHEAIDRMVARERAAATAASAQATQPVRD
ncbi:MAG TPA: polysaccharide deacetylase family protein, partial [Chthonomonadales bacterium]|nr:polysaccharide deacetylase family protein [Chthonomonadales bacterium]